MKQQVIKLNNKTFPLSKRSIRKGSERGVEYLGVTLTPKNLCRFIKCVSKLTVCNLLEPAVNAQAQKVWLENIGDKGQFNMPDFLQAFQEKMGTGKRASIKDLQAILYAAIKRGDIQEAQKLQVLIESKKRI